MLYGGDIGASMRGGGECRDVKLSRRKPGVAEQQPPVGENRRSIGPSESDNQGGMTRKRRQFTRPVGGGRRCSRAKSGSRALACQPKPHAQASPKPHPRRHDRIRVNRSE